MRTIMGLVNLFIAKKEALTSSLQAFACTFYISLSKMLKSIMYQKENIKIRSNQDWEIFASEKENPTKWHQLFKSKIQGTIAK